MIDSGCNEQSYFGQFEVYACIFDLGHYTKKYNSSPCDIECDIVMLAKNIILGEKWNQNVYLMIRIQDWTFNNALNRLKYSRN